MTLLDELIVNASVGTSRKAPALPDADAALADALQTIAGDPPEAKLLGAIAIVSHYQACGRMAAAGAAVPEPAAKEARPACSRGAGDVLAQILAMTNTATKEHLLGEWLEFAARSNRRAPHRMLVALLDYGAAYRPLRRAIAEAAGVRGAWLMRLNPRWQFAAAEQEDPASLWATGAREQRISAIARLRETDPASARTLIESTWKQDTAEDRAAFVASMVTSLGPDDEAFLESALDDRSKQVKSAAADLLARLPQSAYVRRMIGRMEPLLSFQPAAKGGLLKSAKRAVLEITLPPDKFDPSWARDGIVEKPEERIGRRQWWLGQMVAAVSPAHWSTTWGLAPPDCIAVVMGEFADVILSAWHQSAARNPDARWIAALLLAAARDGRGPLTLELLNALPNDARQAITTEILEAPRTGIETVIALLRAAKFPLSRHAATALFRQFDLHVEQQPIGFNYILAQNLAEAALRIPPSFYEELTERWTGDKWQPNRKVLDEFFQILVIRRNLQREFQS